MVMGPTQNNNEAVKKPRTKRSWLPTACFSAPPLLKRASNQAPTAASPSSIFHHSPSSAPTTRLPNTTKAFPVLRNI